MSIQWTLVAGIMYAELFAAIFLLMPFISPQRWNAFFKSNFLKSIGNMGNLYFKIFLGILVLLCMDAIREMQKYGQELKDQEHSEHGVHLDSNMQAQMRLFRAQRNFYISGFALLLWIVLQRLATLISKLAVALAEKEASLKQAKSASDAASKLMKDPKDKDAKSEEKTNLKNEMEELKGENRRLDAEYKAALKQAVSVTDEYDRLLKEHSKLQEEVKKLSKDDECKKDD